MQNAEPKTYTGYVAALVLVALVGCVMPDPALAEERYTLDCEGLEWQSPELIAEACALLKTEFARIGAREIQPDETRNGRYWQLLASGNQEGASSLRIQLSWALCDAGDCAGLASGPLFAASALDTRIGPRHAKRLAAMAARHANGPFANARLIVNEG